MRGQVLDHVAQAPQALVGIGTSALFVGLFLTSPTPASGWLALLLTGDHTTYTESQHVTSHILCMVVLYMLHHIILRQAMSHKLH